MRKGAHLRRPEAGLCSVHLEADLLRANCPAHQVRLDRHARRKHADHHSRVVQRRAMVGDGQKGHPLRSIRDRFEKRLVVVILFQLEPFGAKKAGDWWEGG